jgi:benzoyl-CoA-dihydrodiol lyase
VRNDPVDPAARSSAQIIELLEHLPQSFPFRGTIIGAVPKPVRKVGFLELDPVSPMNFGAYPMTSGEARLAARFCGEEKPVESARRRMGDRLNAQLAAELGLVTFTPDELDWDDEVRIAIEERASYSPDALSGLEANLRFAGPETIESKIFARLSLWQNWIFQRPNAVGERGALRLYGSGQKPALDPDRV